MLTSFESGGGGQEGLTEPSHTHNAPKKPTKYVFRRRSTRVGEDPKQVVRFPRGRSLPRPSSDDGLPRAHPSQKLVDSMLRLLTVAWVSLVSAKCQDKRSSKHSKPRLAHVSRGAGFTCTVRTGGTGDGEDERQVVEDDLARWCQVQSGAVLVNFAQTHAYSIAGSSSQSRCFTGAQAVGAQSRQHHAKYPEVVWVKHVSSLKAMRLAFGLIRDTPSPAI
ncbi:hypothetical protein OPT61_g6427 [Boeremia exigua]|uniref:Uncharacterized protein n=1 Tax=Boeremia exigua TaxID=749465 RepID=A0ACC2I6M0_9PLEO|nr:hypothetical protein OPT61_g6427 [Boeremia exigua]